MAAFMSIFTFYQSLMWNNHTT